MNFNHYFTNEEFDEVLRDWAAQYPSLVNLSELGQSHEGRPIPLLTLTNRETGADKDKPALWIDANIHATEIAGTTTALAIAHRLLSSYGVDNRCTRVYIAPRLNPDGAALALAASPRYVRSGTRPYPEEEKAPGLHMEDIDGDGRILQMRLDPNGDWKISPLDPTGAFDDWVFDYLGIFSFTVELWYLRRKAGLEVKDFIGWFRNHPHEEDLKILRWLEENGGEEAVVDWYPYEHPQLGQVEMGGFNRLFTWRNPSVHFMGEEAERNVPFALALADMLPRLQIQDLQVEPLADGTHRLRLVVENPGFLPTYTSVQGQKRKSARPVRVKLSLPAGAALVSGKLRTELGHLEGRSHRFGISSDSASSPTDNRIWTEWVVRCNAGAEIGFEALSDWAGTL